MMLSFFTIVGQNKTKATFVATLIILVVALGIPFPLLVKAVIDTVLYAHKTSTLWSILSIFVILIALQLLLNFVLSICSSKWSQNISAKLRSQIYQKKISLRTNEISLSQDMTQTGIISDCDVVSTNFQNIYINLISATISLIAYLCILIWLNIYLGLIILMSIPLFILLNLKLSNLSKKYFSTIQKSKDSILAQLMDTVRGFLFIKLYGIEEKYIFSFEKKNKKLTETSVHFNTIITFIHSLVSFLAVVAPVIVLLFGGLLIIKRKSTLGNVIACYSYSSAIFSPIGQLISLMPAFKQLSLSCDRINHLLDSKEKQQINYQNLDGNLPCDVAMQVVHLSVAYNDEKDVISNMNCTFLKSTSYLIEGPNASGKSTFAKCVLGLTKIKKGTIKTDNHFSICYVPQDTYLFQVTVLDNLTIGLHDYNQNLLFQLMRVTLLDKDLAKNNMNLDSQVDNDQSELSTGQVQKIKLIHALLSHPKILIIDELLSNMDKNSQISILSYLKVWVADRKTLIIISHSHNYINHVLNPQRIVFPVRGSGNVKNYL